MQQPAQRQEIGAAAGGEVFRPVFPIQSLKRLKVGIGVILQKGAQRRALFLGQREAAAGEHIGVRGVGEEREQGGGPGLVLGSARGKTGLQHRKTTVQHRGEAQGGAEYAGINADVESLKSPSTRRDKDFSKKFFGILQVATAPVIAEVVNQAFDHVAEIRNAGWGDSLPFFTEFGAALYAP